MADQAYEESLAELDELYQEADSDTLYGAGPDKTVAAGTPAGKAERIRQSSARRSYNEKSVEECADTYLTLENRLRELEAFITSKKFRLHCEINRI